MKVGQRRGFRNVSTPLTEEQNAALTDMIVRGLTNKEACRMFFRKFGRDITENTVKSRRENHG